MAQIDLIDIEGTFHLDGQAVSCLPPDVLLNGSVLFPQLGNTCGGKAWLVQWKPGQFSFQAS